MASGYIAETAEAVFFLDDAGVCVRVDTPPRSFDPVPASAKRCIGAQYVASIDVTVEGALVDMPRSGLPLLFATRDEKSGRISLIRTGRLVSFETETSAGELFGDDGGMDSSDPAREREDDSSSRALPASPPPFESASSPSSAPPHPSDPNAKSSLGDLLEEALADYPEDESGEFAAVTPARTPSSPPPASGREKLPSGPLPRPSTPPRRSDHGPAARAASGVPMPPATAPIPVNPGLPPERGTAPLPPASSGDPLDGSADGEEEESTQQFRAARSRAISSTELRSARASLPAVPPPAPTPPERLPRPSLVDELEDDDGSDDAMTIPGDVDSYKMPSGRPSAPPVRRARDRDDIWQAAWERRGAGVGSEAPPKRGRRKGKPGTRKRRAQEGTEPGENASEDADDDVDSGPPEC